MRKAGFLLICLVFLAVLAACQASPHVVVVSNTPAEDAAALPEPTQPGEAPAEPAASAPAEVSAPAEATAAASAEASTTPVHTTVPESNASGGTMYSSYAYMKTYDPAVGTAEFDYFDMLRGEDAVKWLVEQEGKTQAEAEAEVADYADSEFICKNTNPQLRTVDLEEVPISLMYDPETGDMCEPDAPYVGSLIDLYNLYELDHDLVLDSFFYWVEVSGGSVVALQQVYWP